MHLYRRTAPGDDELGELNVEVGVAEEVEEDTTDPLAKIRTRFIVDLAHVLRQHATILDHSKACRVGGQMALHSVANQGLHGLLQFRCGGCQKYMAISTVPQGDDVNLELAWGSRAIGIGQRQVQEQMALMNVKVPAKNLYRKKANAAGKVSDKNRAFAYISGDLPGRSRRV